MKCPSCGCNDPMENVGFKRREDSEWEYARRDEVVPMRFVDGVPHRDFWAMCLDRSHSKDLFRQHTADVSRFLSELHATMVDPCAEGEIKVEDMMRILLDAARTARQAIYDAQNELASIKEQHSILLKEWRKLSKERWGNVCASDVFQLLKHEPKYRKVLNLLADGQISIGKCAESIAEIAAGCEPNLPEWTGYEDELSWKERHEKLVDVLRSIHSKLGAADRQEAYGYEMDNLIKEALTEARSAINA